MRFEIGIKSFMVNLTESIFLFMFLQSTRFDNYVLSVDIEMFFLLGLKKLVRAILLSFLVE